MSLAELRAACPDLLSTAAWNTQQIGRLLRESAACQQLAAALLSAAAAEQTALLTTTTTSTAMNLPAATFAPPAALGAPFALPVEGGGRSSGFWPTANRDHFASGGSLLAGSLPSASAFANLSAAGMEATAIALTAAAHAQASVATIAPLDDDEFWPPHVRVIMTTIFLLLTVMGVVGNLMVITVVLRVPGMITPTNCYLTSLAVSDCLFFVATAPTELSLLHSAEYIFGPIGCAVFSYLPYLAINTSSLSITAFTIERFIGICYPLRARYICTISRAKLILVVIWVFCLLYNSPWLYLATVTGKDGMRMCSFKLDRDSWAYKLLFLNDFATFYLIPMCLYLVIYAKITLTLTNCALGGKEKSSGRKLPGSNEQATLKKMNSIPSDGFPLPASPPGHPIVAKKSLSSCPSVDYGRRSFVHGGRKGSSRTKVQVQIIKMLAVVVLIFAVCWLPYRLMVMYNSFASVRFDPGWYIFFAKTLVFFNCAINPVLYNAMSARFRNAFRQLLRGKKGAKEVNRGHCTVLTEQPSIRAEDMRPFLPANGGMPTSSTIEKL